MISWPNSLRISSGSATRSGKEFTIEGLVAELHAPRPWASYAVTRAQVVGCPMDPGLDRRREMLRQCAGRPDSGAGHKNHAADGWLRYWRGHPRCRPL